MLRICAFLATIVFAGSVASADPDLRDEALGSWKGNVIQPGSAPYSVEMRIFVNQTGSLVATTNYPELACHGELSLDAASSQSLRFTERIRPQTPNCTSLGYIILSRAGNGALAFSYTDMLGAVMARSALSRAAAENDKAAVKDASSKPSKSAPTLSDNAKAATCVDPQVIAAFYRIVAKVDSHPLMQAGKRGLGVSTENIARFTMIMANGADSTAVQFKCTALEVRVEPSAFTDTFDLVGQDSRGTTYTSKAAAKHIGLNGIKLAEHLAQMGKWETMQDFFLEDFGGGEFRITARYRIVGNEEFTETVTLRTKK